MCEGFACLHCARFGLLSFRRARSVAMLSGVTEQGKTVNRVVNRVLTSVEMPGWMGQRPFLARTLYAVPNLEALWHLHLLCF